MSVPRRFLPPLPWLTAFEAVARLGSVTAAANELDLTQGAVSRQIQKLEELLELPLFHRRKKRLLVTQAGRAYAQDIHSAVLGIANATIALRANPDGGLLDLAILPTYGTHWLAPRLPQFLSEHPGVTVNLATRTRPFDFTQEKFHAAIHYGQDDWPDTQSLKLMDEEMLPVLSPQLCDGRALTPAALTRLPLLHIETRARAWQQWFDRQGLDHDPATGIEFDQFATMLRATLFGAGAALIPRYLVEKELAEGKLVTLDNAAMTDIGAYYLVWPENLADYPPVVAFSAWMHSQVSPDRVR